MTGKELDPGHYALEEITAPNGYVLNIAPVKFKVSSNTAYETLPDGATPVITVTKQDTSVKGRIAVVKQERSLLLQKLMIMAIRSSNMKCEIEGCCVRSQGSGRYLISR